EHLVAARAGGGRRTTPRVVGRPRSRGVTRGRSAEGDLADAHAPDLGALLEVLPGELPGVLGGELVVQRLRVVVVHEHEGGARFERAERVEDEFVPYPRNLLADVDDLVGVGHARPLSVWGHAGAE